MTTVLSETPHSADAYRAAGVDLDAANAVVGIAKKSAQTTRQPWGALSSIGGFSGGFVIPEGYKKPVLLAACDGVGTKLALAGECKDYSTVGIDLVAMSVNDLVVSGGQPLVFLDYVATGKLDLAALETLLESVAEGCRQSGCQLIGGETAEMPGFYAEGHVDVAGFCVGVVEATHQLPNLSALKPGDAVIGLRSNGLHSNGYSLARHILAEKQIPLSFIPEHWEQTISESLLAPTKIYVKPVLEALTQHRPTIRAMAHITGGGLTDNIPRVLPNELGVELHPATWDKPPIMAWLQQQAQLDDATVFHTWNGGIGFVLIVGVSEAKAIISTLQQADASLSPRIIGSVVNKVDNGPSVSYV
ncbi:MAG: phosphoribosylformylglycinamidine cyclo-ligase [Vampirovibrionales bacterium]|nr:phosphoribosylformylglycinamidine cyclo-ligase [Vampirovibrionales bacterium]